MEPDRAGKGQAQAAGAVLVAVDSAGGHRPEPEKGRAEGEAAAWAVVVKAEVTAGGVAKRAANREGSMEMPGFASPFTGVAHDRKLTDEELIRALRFMVAAEYEAIQLYMQLAESIDNPLAIEVLKDIADEERVHAGEFMRLLHEIAPDEQEHYARGAAEVEEEIEKLKKGGSNASR